MERKEQIRAYKESPRPMGVYRVRNLRNGKSLVGSSVDVPAMLNRQRFQLESGFHPDRALLAEWREFGPDAFAFETLDTLEPPDEPDHDPAADLKTLEAMWLEKLGRAGERGYR
jgi:hypothetical protein